MPFLILPYRRFPFQCPVIYNVGPFQGHGTVWSLSPAGVRLSGDLPMRPGESFSPTVTLPNEQRIEISQAVVRWVNGDNLAVETVTIATHTQARLHHSVTRLVRSEVPDGFI